MDYKLLSRGDYFKKTVQELRAMTEEQLIHKINHDFPAHLNHLIEIAPRMIPMERRMYPNTQEGDTAIEGAIRMGTAKIELAKIILLEHQRKRLSSTVGGILNTPLELTPQEQQEENANRVVNPKRHQKETMDKAMSVFSDYMNLAPMNIETTPGTLEQTKRFFPRKPRFGSAHAKRKNKFKIKSI
jgi:hypothetical protein